VQRLINIKIARAYRTTSHEALCVLTGITPILIELRSLAKIYHNTRWNTQIGLYDDPKLYSKWNHPADAIELKEKFEGREYAIEIYTDGSKSSSGVGSGIAIFVIKHLTLQLMYKLAEECSNKQAEQLAIVKTLEKLQDFRHVQEGQRSAAIHTDSKITLDATANPRNHQNLLEQIREGVRRLEKDNWTIHFTWVKAHNDNFGNELADQLAKKAASSREGETAYSKIPKSAVIKVVQEEGELEWQKEWNASTKEEITKSFFPVIGDRKSKILQMGIKLSTLVTGRGTLRSY
jgi:ribonuclease HI